MEIEKSARRSVATMLRVLKAQNNNKEVGPLIKSCKLLNDTREINNAVREISRQ